MATNIYLLRVGSFNNTTQRFEFYRNEVFSSKKNINRAIENMIDCNNGYNVTTEDMDFGKKETHITYSCMSAPVDGEPRPMRVRYVVEKLKLNNGY